MALVACNKIGAEICEILGLDSNRVRSISLVFDPYAVVLAKVEFYTDGAELEKIKTLMIKYKMQVE